MDFFHIIALLLVERRIEHQMGHAHDAIHGRAYLVAHVCQKNALGGIGGFGAFLGLAQNALVLAGFCHIAGIAGYTQHAWPAHHLVGKGIPAQPLAGMRHAQFQMLLPGGPQDGRTQFAPLVFVLGHNARAHAFKPFCHTVRGIDAKLLVKNIVAGQINLTTFQPGHFKHAKPAQAAGQ